MIRLIGAELFKLRKRSMTWILLAIFIGIIVLLYLLLYAISRISLPNPSQAPPGLGNIPNLLGLPAAVPFALSILASFGTLLAIVLVGSTMGNEYNWRTIRVALAASESRFKFAAAKVISSLIVVLIGMVVGMFVGFAMSLLTTYIGGYAFDFSFATGSYVWGQFLQFWRTSYILFLYMMLAFLFAIVGRSAMSGIAVGVGVLFLESIITTFMRLAGGWVASIPDYLLTANVNAIQRLNQLPGNIGEGFGGSNAVVSPSIVQSYWVLGGYTVAFIIIAFWLFQRRDVTG